MTPIILCNILYAYKGLMPNMGQFHAFPLVNMALPQLQETYRDLNYHYTWMGTGYTI